MLPQLNYLLSHLTLKKIFILVVVSILIYVAFAIYFKKWPFQTQEGSVNSSSTQESKGLSDKYGVYKYYFDKFQPEHHMKTEKGKNALSNMKKLDMLLSESGGEILFSKMNMTGADPLSGLFPGMIDLTPVMVTINNKKLNFFIVEYEFDGEIKADVVFHDNNDEKEQIILEEYYNNSLSLLFEKKGVRTYRLKGSYNSPFVVSLYLLSSIVLNNDRNQKLNSSEENVNLANFVDEKL